MINALGGDDTVSGAGGDDTITGGGGNDFIDGGAETDTAVYSGAWVDYAISGTGPDSLSVTRAPTRLTVSIPSAMSENFQFSNGTFAAAQIANDAPTDVALLASSIAEPASNDTIVASITSMDADTPLGDTATYTLVDDAGGRFAISGTDLVVADGSLLDAETAVSHSVTVRATDAHGLSDDQIFNISVNDVDEFNVTTPVDTDGTTGGSVDANAAAGTVVGITASASDADVTTNAVAYSLTSNPDSLFAIDANTGVVTTAAALNGAAGTTVNIQVTASSADGSRPAAQSFGIAVTSATQAPMITSNGGGATATISIAENSKAVTTVTATDPDSSNLTYSLAGGADQSLFTINAVTGALAFLTAPDYEHPTDSGGNRVFDVTVQVSDGSLTDSQAIAVTVTNATPNETVTGDGDPNTFRASADKEAFSGQGGSDTVSYDTASAAVTANLASPNKNKGDASGDTYSSIENLRGSNFGDKLTGDNNDNVLEGGSGADKLDGGKGVNTASYEHAGTRVTADLSNAANNTGEALGDKYSSIQNLTGSAFDDKLTGDGGANALIGGSGADTLTGAGGKDMLTGGLGNDTFVFTTLQDSSIAAPDLITDFAVGDMIDLSAIDANTWCWRQPSIPHRRWRWACG